MNEKELKELLQDSHYEIFTKLDTPSQFIITEKYKIILVRGVVVENHSLALHVRRFLVQDELILEYFLDKNSFQKVASFETLWKNIKDILEHYDDVLDGYSEAVDEKEDSLYKRQIDSLFLNTWFNLKKDLATIDRVLVRLEYVLVRIQKFYNKADIEELVEDISISRRFATFELGRLDAIYSYFYSLKNEKMNDQIFILTLISAIFLPINLIVGFFGMNTQNLFFSNAPQGTMYVVYLMFFVLISITATFFIYRFIKQKILLKLANQFSIHKKIKKTLLEND